MRKLSGILLGLAVFAIALAAYELGRADESAGLERTIVPAV